MQKCGALLTIFVILSCFVFVKSNLSLEGKQCGQKVCKRDEYCAKHTRICAPCAEICNRSIHNYDASECVEQCQDYIHDNLYVLKDGVGNDDENLKATVQKLSRMITGTLILVCFMLVVLASVLCFQIYRWKKKKNITIATIKDMLFSKKSNSSQHKTTSVTNPPTNGKPELHLEIPAESTHSGNSPVTVTTSISRRPAEDSTLDYAYDNPAMSSSPNNKNTQNSF